MLPLDFWVSAPFDLSLRRIKLFQAYAADDEVYGDLIGLGLSLSVKTVTTTITHNSLVFYGADQGQRPKKSKRGELGSHRALGPLSVNRHLLSFDRLGAFNGKACRGSALLKYHLAGWQCNLSLKCGVKTKNIGFNGSQRSLYQIP